MQKVEGSSPFIRLLEKPCVSRGFFVSAVCVGFCTAVVRIRYCPSSARRLLPDPSAVSIRQALANLLDNAIKFSRHQPHPEVWIDGRQDDISRILRIRDNGIGFDIAQTDRIFGVFERLHLPHEYEGTGVGLAIVRLVMDKHGGRVTVESAPDYGSAFSLVFPSPQT